MPLPAILFALPFTLSQAFIDNTSQEDFVLPQPATVTICAQTPHIYHLDGMNNDPAVAVKKVCHTSTMNVGLDT